MPFQTQRDRDAAKALSEKLLAHIAVKDASPGFHLSDNDISLCQRALHAMAKHPIDN